MFSRLLVILSILASTRTLAQQGDFCEAITAIANDAPAKFRNVRGKLVDAASRKGLWEANIKVPGSVASRFVQSMGLFYEGAFFQSKTQAGVKDAYEKLKRQLTDCLQAQGYNISYQPNFYSGLGDLKKVVFMRELGSQVTGDNAPAHFALEALYSKQVGNYTVVMYIFEH